MRQLTLTNDQFDALFEYMREVVETLEDYMITKKDDNGNEVLEDISKYEAYQIYQQLVSLKDDAKVTITPQQLEGDISTVTDDDYADKVDTLVDNMEAHDDNKTDKVYPQVDDVPDNIKKEWLYNYTHDSEGC